MFSHPIHFEACGHFTSREPWTHPERTIRTVECMVITQGEVWIREDGELYELHEGDVLFLEPERRHGGDRVSVGKVSFYWIHMTPFCLGDGDAPMKQFSLREPYPVSLLFRQILHYSTQGFPAQVCDALLCVLLAELAGQSHPEEDAAVPLALRVREWIRINSDRPLEVSHIADHFGYNADYLSRLIRKSYGTSLKGLIARYRMQEIRTLLLRVYRRSEDYDIPEGGSEDFDIAEAVEDVDALEA